MKIREPRRKVVLKARVRAAASWHDACILNVSTRGLLVQTFSPPPRGAYLEVRRGPHVIVARVVWEGDRRVGLIAQDPLPVAIESDAALASPQYHGGSRSARRVAALRHEQGRQTSRTWQAVALGFAGLVGAGALALGLQATLGASMDRIHAALGAGINAR